MHCKEHTPEIYKAVPSSRLIYAENQIKIQGIMGKAEGNTLPSDDNMQRCLQARVT
jgi:hypothetical protein